jgi:hypothetical protein
MVEAVWVYEKDIAGDENARWPEAPYTSYEAEISDLDFTDLKKLRKVVEDLKQMGADFIVVCPDFRRLNGDQYPHIGVSFPDEEQVIKCASKYTGGQYSAPGVSPSPVKRWCLSPRD